MNSPPGSLSLWNSLRALRQRGFYARQAALHGPIFKTRQFDKKVICIANLALAHRLFRDHSSSITPSPQVFTKDLSGGFLRFMEPTQHRFYGPMFRRALGKQVISESVTYARAIICQHLSAVATRPILESDLLTLTHDIFTRVLFGFEQHTPQLAAFESRFQSIASHTMAQRLNPQALADLDHLRDSFRAPQPNPCTLSEMSAQLGGTPDNTSIDNLLFILRISTDDAAGLLRWILEFLGRHPEWLNQVRLGTYPGLPARIVKETLRLSRSEYLYRLITKDFDFENYRFPAGWMIRVCVAECHRDPAHFPDPESFNPDRFLGPQPTDQIYSPFGMREHSCSGAELATTIATLFIEQLAAYDILVSGPTQPRRGLRHWMHWAPASTIQLQARR